MDPAERFVDAATAPLAETNAELHLAAQQELRERIDPSDEDSLGAASERLETVKRPRWIPALLILMGLVSLPVILHTGMQHRALRTVYNTLNFNYSTSGKPPAFVQNLSAKDQLLLHGDLSKQDLGERWKALWDTRPDHAPYFANYVGHYISEHDALPSDFLETATRIDPDNGWYWAIAAAFESKGNITKARQSMRDRDAGLAPVWTIKDPARHRKSLELLDIAISKPRLTSHANVLLSQQIPLLPKRSDYLSRFSSLAWFAGHMNFNFNLRFASELIAAEAQRCGDEKDLDGFRSVQSLQRTMAERSIEDSHYLIDALLTKVSVSSSARNFRDASKALGLDSDADAYQQVDEVLNPNRKERDRRADRSVDLELLVQRKASVLGSISLPMVSRQAIEPVKIREDELSPARSAEYALFGRLASLIIWAILGVSLALVQWIRPSPRVIPMALRIRELFLPVDWAWIIGGGILGPALWHLLIAQLSPLAAHHWSMRLSSFLIPIGQFAATALLMIIAPILIVRWRMNVRMPFLRFRSPCTWAAWLAVFSAMIAIPVLGVLPQIGSFSDFLLYSFTILLGYPLLWLIAVVFKIFFLNKDRTLASRTIATALVPAYAAGMLLTMLCVPIFHAVEKQWVAHDHLMGISTEELSLTRYEYRVTQQLKSELLDTFHKLPGK
ncbi:hypothetical protein [Haloferula sp.]|uniref:hypothetical protein n=1 Tax=Haloferula sp. TaxID=2497595 RepID=UPI0032A0FAE6